MFHLCTFDEDINYVSMMQLIFGMCMWDGTLFSIKKRFKALLRAKVKILMIEPLHTIVIYALCVISKPIHHQMFTV